MSLSACMQLMFCLYKPVIREWEPSLLGSNENLNRAPLCSTGLLLPRHNRSKTTVNHCLCLLLLLPCVSTLPHKLHNVITKLSIVPIEVRRFHAPRTCSFLCCMVSQTKNPYMTLACMHEGCQQWIVFRTTNLNEIYGHKDAPTQTRRLWHHFSHGIAAFTCAQI